MIDLIFNAIMSIVPLPPKPIRIDNMEVETPKSIQPTNHVRPLWTFRRY
ncbi:MAG: hypothetical protein WC284_18500 [Candidimonas sp.]